MTIKKGNVQVFKSQEFFFKILKVQLHQIGTKMLLVIATDKIAIYELKEYEDKLLQTRKLMLDKEICFGVTDFYFIGENVLAYLTTSGDVYLVDLCIDPVKNLMARNLRQVDKNVLAIGKCVSGEPDQEGSLEGRLMVVKQNT